MNIFGAKDDNKRSADLTVEGAANQLPHTFRLASCVHPNSIIRIIAP
jgi:hypothetical protein